MTTSETTGVTRIALVGNPNSGKTTVFNAITGARQHVGNYPGVTVEKKTGHCRRGGCLLEVVDLPGTYSLTAASEDELVARHFILQDRPDVVVDVVDASNLERNLYLTTQLIELGVPLVVALNMADAAEAGGKLVDDDLLGRLLGVPIVRTVGTTGAGMDELLDAAVDVAEEHRAPRVQIPYGSELETHVDALQSALAKLPGLAGHNLRWHAVKLLENDAEAAQAVRAAGGEKVLNEAARVRSHLEGILGDDPEIVLADQRYGFITGASREAVRLEGRHGRDWSEAIDTVAAGRVLGLPVFFGLMWLMFALVFLLGSAPMALIGTGFTWLGSVFNSIIPPGPIRSLVVDGLIGGVGGVLRFVPNIFLLFVALALLEDSGYMARAAFVVDRVMHRIGLHGKSFIPLLIGFGCTVPAVMATRTLASRRDRLVTMLITPLMSCGARLPVYVLLAGAFFRPQIAGHVIFSVYLLGVLAAVASAKLFRLTIFRGPNEPFVMELPPYRVPTLRGTLVHAWQRVWAYMRKAGTVILAISVLMWFLLSYPAPPRSAAPSVGHVGSAAGSALAYSYAGRMGRSVEPLIRPLGFNWRVGIGLISGVAAKEVVVSTLGTTYSLGTDHSSQDLLRELRADPSLNPLIAYVLMVFVLLYVPCAATLVAIARESGTWRWAAFASAYNLAIAWLASFVIYQAGHLLGLG